MNNEFPKMLYRCPGPMTYEGASFDTTIVNDADEEAAADGWHAHPDAAKEARAAQIAAEAAAAEAAAAEAAAQAAADTKPKKG